MKKLVILLLCGAFTLSCADKEYDLSQIETGDIAIGNDDSEFRMPLMTVLVPMSDLSADGKEIQAIFDEADIWLPTAATSVDLVRLDSDPDYRDQLTAGTIAEMHTSDAKLNAVIGLSYERYYADFAPILGLDPAHPDPNAYAAAFGRIFASEELAGELEAHISNAATDYLTSIHIDPVEYSIDALGIDESVIDMLCDNLDPEGTPDARNTLYLYGSTASRLPVTMHVAPTFTPTDITFEFDVEAASPDSSIPQTQLFGDDLRQLVGGITVRIPVTLLTYYRDLGFDDAANSQLTIDLRLFKRGGLKLNL
ncbi:hypothetical protein [uncultured Alistipes sp.]|uniref:hypothetical protein n=1 Tax=uncultured Alistipes sp. TaxID=538949 RepID=UPI00262AB446|nr:hypothetical protein [uncultured Alistipes sp.]